MPMEEFFGREVSVWGQPFVADGLDVAHLNVLITKRPVIRPDDAACAGIAPVQRPLLTLGSNYLVHSEATDLLTIAQCQCYLRTSCRALKELVEDAFAVRVSPLHFLFSEHPKVHVARSLVVGCGALIEHQQVGGWPFSRSPHARGLVPGQRCSSA